MLQSLIPVTQTNRSAILNKKDFMMASVDIPKQQRAAVRQGSGDDATAPVKQIDVTMPGPGQILVKVNWTGLCASVSFAKVLDFVEGLS